MAVIRSTVNPRSAEFAANRAAMAAAAADLHERVLRVMEGGPAQARERHLARGKLLPRERVGRLLDPGSPFLEIGLLAAPGMHDDEVPAAGMIAGIGRVCGTECMIVCNDAT